MKTLTKENLLEFLVEHDACQPGLDWAKKQRRARDIIEKCPDVNYLHWLIGAIGGPLRAEYKKKEAPFWAKYSKKVAPLLDEHCKKIDPLWAEYKEKRAPFLAEYDEKCHAIAKKLCTFERVQEAISI